MEHHLLRIVEERLKADGADQHDWSLFVLTACEGGDALEQLLGGAQIRRHGTTDAPKASQLAHEPKGAYLRSISVEGFRGVGPRRTLDLVPGPGLTLVVGRNGSGKSSFAEGLEILLTGSNWRWRDRSSVWRQGWRNLHHPSPTQVSAELAVEGSAGATTVTRTWPDGADLVDSEAHISTASTKSTDLDSLGWSSALGTYRPFLSYSELGSMFDEGPTALHDRLSRILGLGELEDAQQLLKNARLPREQGLAAAKKKLPPLLARLAATPDERATRARAALVARHWDLDAAAVVLESGAAIEGGDKVSLLRTLASLPSPTVEQVLAVTAALEDVVERRARIAGTPAGEAREIAGLLRAALAFHAGHGDGDCPVCGRSSALDVDWHDTAAARATALEAAAAEALAVEQDARAAMERVQRLLGDPPAVLARAAEIGLDSVTLDSRWGAFLAAPRDDVAALAAHLESTIGPFAEAADAFRAETAAELTRREDRWRPVAIELAGWLGAARAAEAAGKSVEDLEAAEKWIKGAAVGIRQLRFAPIAAAAIEHWNTLRQQSSVDLGRILLEGTGPSRHVTLDVTIDGVDGAALGVMSQGELHAIALSLFLPRATLPESPFRFVVIDDPVQSMDPSRVDGLARVLDSVAKRRQVVVFTHDDRLPEAVRRLGIDARVWQVTRHEDSVVELRSSLDPVRRNLDDALALARTDDLPMMVAQQVVPGFCRAAIEASCVEVIRRRRIGRGEAHADVEDLIQGAPKLNERMALALFDTANRGADVAGKVRSWGEPFADAWGISNRGAHAGYRGSLEDLVRDTDRLCRVVRETK